MPTRAGPAGGRPRTRRTGHPPRGRRSARRSCSLLPCDGGLEPGQCAEVAVGMPVAEGAEALVAAASLEPLGVAEGGALEAEVAGPVLRARVRAAVQMEPEAGDPRAEAALEVDEQ